MNKFSSQKNVNSTCQILMSAMILAILILLPGYARAQDNSTEDILSQIETYPHGKLDLFKAVKRGLEANPLILSNKYQYEGEEDSVKGAKGEFLPSLVGNYRWRNLNNNFTNYGYDTDYMDQDEQFYMVRLSQPLFTGTRILTSYQRSMLIRDNAAARLRQIKLDITSRVQSEFLTLLRIREDISAIKESIVRLNSQLDAAKAFFRVGLKPWLNVLQAEVDLTDAQQELSIANNRARIQEVKLNALLNIPVDKHMDYEGRLQEMSYVVPFDLATCRDLAAKNRPDLVIAKKAVEIASKDVRLAMSRFVPNVSLNFDYNVQDRDYTAKGTPDIYREYWTTSVNVDWEIFNGGRDYYNVAKERKRMNALEAEAQDSRNQAMSDVQSSYLSLLESRARIKTARKGMEEARESFDMASTRYRTDVGTSVDVLDAQAKVTNAEGSYFKALADYQQSLSNLYHAIGLINEGLTDTALNTIQ